MQFLLRSSTVLRPIRAFSSSVRYNNSTVVSSSISSLPSSSSSSTSNILPDSSLSSPTSSSENVQAPPKILTFSSSSPIDRPPSPPPVRYTKHSYFVPRVGKIADQLPVYTDIRNGGSHCVTEIRKIQGNINDLRRDLEDHLQFPQVTVDDIHVKSIKTGRKRFPKSGFPTKLIPVQLAHVSESGKIKVRGNKVREVKLFLASKGF